MLERSAIPRVALAAPDDGTEEWAETYLPGLLGPTAQASPTASSVSSAFVPRDQPLEVVVKDFQMSFGSMVVFMIKWSLAAIPALLILAATGLIFYALLTAISGIL